MAITDSSLRRSPVIAALPAFVATLFLSAFLLFAVQPMFTKMVLPILGGAPGVWSVAMVFFQAVLLAGYGYAHVLARLPVRRAVMVHLALMAAALLTLPIALAPLASSPPSWGQAPWLFAVFALSVGVPFFAVSANGPLLQAWFSRSGHPHAGDPYFLYGASNIGSFAALLAYPVLIEPFASLKTQGHIWTGGFVLLAVAIASCALIVFRDGTEVEEATVTPVSAAPTLSQRLSWIGLSAVPSGLLVAVTAHISTDVASAPLLWVVPLALFLLTFVLVFRARPLLSLRTLGMLQVGLVVVVFVLTATNNRQVALTLPAHLLLFLVNAMVCHSVLYARRPAADRLTDFYLMMSLGGVLGGIFCALAAPVLFSSIVEYPLLIGAALICGNLASRRQILVAGALAVMIVVPSLMTASTSVRSFFGVHRVQQSADGDFRLIVHGTIVHGAMRVRNADGSPADGRPEATTYYTADGPMASAVRYLRDVHGGRIGRSYVVGLGAGVMNCLFRDGEERTFFEIDAAVVGIAEDRTKFRFLSDCGARPEIVLGDARLTLPQRAEKADLIVLDAFTSDAIPLHLVTREAIGAYDARLAEGGALVFNLSNKYFALSRILARTAADAGYKTFVRLDLTDEPPSRRLRTRSLIAVLVRDDRDAGPMARGEGGWIRVEPEAGIQPWTDDYSNILSAMADKFRDTDVDRVTRAGVPVTQ